jgi:hypothetical protein
MEIKLLLQLQQTLLILMENRMDHNYTKTPLININ